MDYGTFKGEGEGKVDGILKEDRRVGFIDEVLSRKAEIINRQRDIINIKVCEGTLGRAFLTKLMIEGIENEIQDDKHITLYSYGSEHFCIHHA